MVSLSVCLPVWLVGWKSQILWKLFLSSIRIKVMVCGIDLLGNLNYDQVFCSCNQQPPLRYIFTMSNSQTISSWGKLEKDTLGQSLSLSPTLSTFVVGKIWRGKCVEYVHFLELFVKIIIQEINRNKINNWKNKESSVATHILIFKKVKERWKTPLNTMESAVCVYVYRKILTLVKYNSC